MHHRSRSYSSQRGVDIWPGFVDALSTLLLVVVFVLMVFMVAQFSLGYALNDRDEALRTLDQEVARLANLLSLEKAESSRLRTDVVSLSETLESRTVQFGRLSDQLAALASEKKKLGDEMLAVTENLKIAEEKRRTLKDQLSDLESEAAELSAAKAGVDAELVDAYQTIEADKERIEVQLSEIALLEGMRDSLSSELKQSQKDNEQLQQQQEAQQELTKQAKSEVSLLNQQVASLRHQLLSLSEALEVSEALSEEQEAKIDDLGERLNVALANKVQQLARYRSEFFGRLREILGNRDDVRIVGDRFVFQSEVLFGSGETTLDDNGKQQLASLARALKDISAQIPDDIEWVLRVDGHTDSQPISTPLYPSNWELSTARAVSVVRFLVQEGIPARNLAATGFGEFQPLSRDGTPESLRRNRRIELKFTQR